MSNAENQGNSAFCVLRYSDVKITLGTGALQISAILFVQNDRIV
jgi:hypothetical protein